ncbi:hypothetical protein TNCV_4195981 [Trichonephila clavipes]|nr:hypothetical protein TNCV_4195981 [Trichonephila clavipes]
MVTYPHYSCLVSSNTTTDLPERSVHLNALMNNATKCRINSTPNSSAVNSFSHRSRGKCDCGDFGQEWRLRDTRAVSTPNLFGDFL